jgi:hypothetical protein
MGSLLAGRYTAYSEHWHRQTTATPSGADLPAEFGTEVPSGWERGFKLLHQMPTYLHHCIAGELTLRPQLRRGALEAGFDDNNCGSD